jgi:hypothetical protein
MSFSTGVAPVRRPRPVSASDPIPWGKHKGLPIEQVPADYLRWALRDMDACNPDSDRFWPEFKEVLEKLVGAIPPGERPRVPSVPILCAQLSQAGVKLSALRGQLQTSGPVSPEQELAIRIHRHTLVAVLTCAEPPDPARNGSARLIWGAHVRCLVKDWFRKLARQFHPDMGGSTEAQMIANQAYKSLMTDLETWEKDGGKP